MPATKLRNRRVEYPMGSVSSGTMRLKDLIPAFTSKLESLARQTGIVPAKTRKEHLKLVREIEARHVPDCDVRYRNDAECPCEILESLFDVLNEYTGPYFYFGAYPGNGSDYGFWLSEDWDEAFIPMGKDDIPLGGKSDAPDSIQVSDSSDIPSWFRGEVAVVNDHGNVTLYVKTSRSLREVWSVV